jgi:hypothetical protein
MIPKLVTKPSEVYSISESELLVIDNLGLIDWKPNFTELSKKTGLGITTCWDCWERINSKAKVTVNIDLRRKNNE